ncbi:helix-turn-helix domain-containing protein [Maritalea porphyrae]|uniref:helix-turn-helix domain-containing protein n=1 Tax=Maritalea porphyrae TaxID=880732 RepID=UPI003AFB69C6
MSEELCGLSLREKECLELLAVGLRPANIGVQLQISRRTVESYIESAKLKLNARTRDQAIAIAIQARIIQP